MTTAWKFADSRRLAVFRLLDDGSCESCRADRADVQGWVEAGNVILDPDPPPAPSKDEADAAAARELLRVKALVAMTPAQVDAYIEQNITNIATAKDAIKTLAIAVSVLARRL